MDDSSTELDTTYRLAERFSYLDSLLTRDGSTVLKMSTRVSKARVKYGGLKHLRRRSDILLKFVDTLSCAWITLYDCETCPKYIHRWNILIADVCIVLLGPRE